MTTHSNPDRLEYLGDHMQRRVEQVGVAYAMGKAMDAIEYAGDAATDDEEAVDAMIEAGVFLLIAIKDLADF